MQDPFKTTAIWKTIAGSEIQKENFKKINILLNSHLQLKSSLCINYLCGIGVHFNMFNILYNGVSKSIQVCRSLETALHTFPHDLSAPSLPPVTLLQPLAIPECVPVSPLSHPGIFVDSMLAPWLPLCPYTCASTFAQLVLLIFHT